MQSFFRSIYKVVYRSIIISRPIFWPSTFFAFLLGTIFSKNPISIGSLFFALLWSFPYSLWICSINDTVDITTDKKNPVRGGLSGARVDLEEVPFLRKLQYISLLIILIPSFFTLNILLWISSLFTLLIPYLYSVKPVRLKERPPLDSLSNGAFVAMVFLSGYLFNGYKPINLITIQALIGFILGVSAIHIIGALRDYSFDKKDHIRTIAVSWGQKRSALVSGVLFILLYIDVLDFPVEFLIFAMLGVFISMLLYLKPGEKLSIQLGLILLVGFFLAAGYSLLNNSWLIFF